jgi:low affinity Fe/Cu permease
MDNSANLSMKEKLDLAILNDKRCKNMVLSVSKDFSKAIRKEIAVFEEEEKYQTDECRIGARIFSKWKFRLKITLITRG